MLFQKVQQRYTRLMNTIYLLVILLTNHETPYNLKILCWASNHLLTQSLPFFSFTGLWPNRRISLGLNTKRRGSVRSDTICCAWMWYDNDWSISGDTICHDLISRSDTITYVWRALFQQNVGLSRPKPVPITTIWKHDYMRFVAFCYDSIQTDARISDCKLIVHIVEDFWTVKNVLRSTWLPRRADTIWYEHRE